MLTDLESEPEAASSDSANPKSSSGKRIVFNRHWLPIVKGTWLLVFISSSVVTLVGLPAENNLYQAVCTTASCLPFQPSVQQANSLQNLGLSLGNYALYNVALDTASIIIYFSLAWLVFWRRPQEPVPFLLGLLFLTISPNNALVSLANDNSSLFQLPARILNLIAFLVLFLIFYLFPDSRFVPGWTAKLMVFVFFFLTLSDFFPAPDWLQLPGLIIYLLLLLSLLVAQVYRYKRISGPTQKQQTKWVALGLGVVIVANIINLLIPVVLHDLASNTLYGLLNHAIFTFITLVLPITIVIAVLRYGLWDIYLVINRTLVYILLSLSVVGIYILTVGILGALFQTQGNFIISLIATALVAIGFHPAQAALQRVVNRLMFGERNQPYQVISRLGERLEKSFKLDEVLQTIVETVAQSLKLPFVGLALKQREITEFVLVASYGQVEGKYDLLTLPLLYQEETIGQLQLASRAKGEKFNPADLQLLNDLTRQAGVSLHAVQLTLNLQQERERLVKAREEERRRISRDLHDGLGPTLAGISLQLTTLQNVIKNQPQEAVRTLGEIKSQTQEASANIRRLIYALHPPELELGLLTALKNIAARHNAGQGVILELDLPPTLPALPAAVELATYRIAQEALTNIVKHSLAKRAYLSLRLLTSGQPKPTLVTDLSAILVSANTNLRMINPYQVSYLELEISDEGIGFPEIYRNGIGLVSLRERVSELNGDWLVETTPNKGSRLVIQLPFLPEEVSEGNDGNKRND